MMGVPNVTMAKGGTQDFGSGSSLGAVLERSKLEFVMPTPPQQAPKLDDGGSGGDIGKGIHNGGGGGDGDGGDDDDYFNEDGDGEGEGGEGQNSWLRTVIPESYDKFSIGAVFAEWMRTIADLPLILRRAVEMGLFSSAQLVRFFSMDVRPNVTRSLSRALPPTVRWLLRAPVHVTQHPSRCSRACARVQHAGCLVQLLANARVLATGAVSQVGRRHLVTCAAEPANAAPVQLLCGCVPSALTCLLALAACSAVGARLCWAAHGGPSLCAENGPGVGDFRGRDALLRVQSARRPLQGRAGPRAHQHAGHGSSNERDGVDGVAHAVVRQRAQVPMAAGAAHALPGRGASRGLLGSPGGVVSAPAAGRGVRAPGFGQRGTLRWAWMGAPDRRAPWGGVNRALSCIRAHVHTCMMYRGSQASMIWATGGPRTRAHIAQRGLRHHLSLTLLKGTMVVGMVDRRQAHCQAARPRPSDLA